MKKASTWMLIATAFAVVVLPAVKGATPTYPDPHGFTWGVATAAYQIEGATTEDGRGPSIWDTFSSTLTPSGHNHTDLGDDGSIADDSYHKWDQDIALMKVHSNNHHTLLQELLLLEISTLKLARVELYMSGQVYIISV